MLNLNEIKAYLDLGFTHEQIVEMCKGHEQPEVANAVVVNEQVAPKVAHSMSKADLIAMEIPKQTKSVSVSNDIDFIVQDFKPRNARKNRKGLAYNQYVGKKVWTYNHLQIKKNYPNIKYSNGCYYADELSDLQNFASSYHIVTELTDKQVAEVLAHWESKKTK